MQGYVNMIAKKPKDKFMLDIKRILKDKQEIQKRLQAKDPSVNLDEVIELYHRSTKMQTQLDNMMHNKVNINRLQQDMEEARENIEKLKDKLREANGG